MKDKPLPSQEANLEFDSSLPTVFGDLSSDFEGKLVKIEKLLTQMTQRQVNGVSAEFNALMDGYVAKANESQTYKAKYDHLHGLYEDLKEELKTFKEANEELKLDLDKSNLNLKNLTGDYSLLQKDKEALTKQSEERINSLIEERDRLKTRIKQLLEFREQSELEINKVKTEMTDLSNEFKKTLEEKRIQAETNKQMTLQYDKQITDLKAKLELKARELDYKDALLNQLIKQVSEEDVLLETMEPESKKTQSESKVVKPKWGAFRK